MNFIPIFCNLYIKSIIFRLDDSVFDIFLLKVVIYICGSNWLSDVEDECVVNVASSVEPSRGYFCSNHVTILIKVRSTVKVVCGNPDPLQESQDSFIRWNVKLVRIRTFFPATDLGLSGRIGIVTEEFNTQLHVYIPGRGLWWFFPEEVDMKCLPCFTFWTGDSVPDYFFDCLESLRFLGGLDVTLCLDGPKLNHVPITVVSLEDLLSRSELKVYRSLRGRYVRVNRADYFRVVVLAKYGGFYCDTDVFAIRPFSELVKGASTYIASEDGLHLSNGIVYAASPHQPVFDYMYEHFLERYRPDTFNLVGPRWYSELVYMFDKVDYVSKRHYFVGWEEFKKLFEPTSVTVEELLQEDVYSIHLWGEMLRRTRFRVSNAHPDSLFVKLTQYLESKRSIRVL